MKTQASALTDDFDDPLLTIEEDEEAHEEDLWFLPGPFEEEPDDLPPGPRAEPPGTAVIEDWAKAEGVHAARLARVAGRLGALDDRLLRGPEGWRQRLALIEAADLSWLKGDRVSADRLALWVSMRLSGAQDDPNALARVGWAVRRLTGGPGPKADLAAFLDRRDPQAFESLDTILIAGQRGYHPTRSSSRYRKSTADITGSQNHQVSIRFRPTHDLIPSTDFLQSNATTLSQPLPNLQTDSAVLPPNSRSNRAICPVAF